jgi:hypothetical protein
MFVFYGVNFWAVLVAALAAFVIGAIWFGPKTFYPMWWKALGKSPDQQPGSANMFAVFGLTFVGVLLASLGLAMLISFANSAFGPIGWATGAFLGGLLGLLIGGGTSLSHRMFSGQGFKVWLLEVGNDVVALAAAGAILAIWR